MGPWRAGAPPNPVSEGPRGPPEGSSEMGVRRWRAGRGAAHHGHDAGEHDAEPDDGTCTEGWVLRYYCRGLAYFR
eukprot:7247927-Pyramimonas_sp.AAC.1